MNRLRKEAEKETVTQMLDDDKGGNSVSKGVRGGGGLVSHACF